MYDCTETATEGATSRSSRIYVLIILEGCCDMMKERQEREEGYSNVLTLFPGFPN